VGGGESWAVESLSDNTLRGTDVVRGGLQRGSLPTSDAALTILALPANELARGD